MMPSSLDRVTPGVRGAVLGSRASRPPSRPPEYLVSATQFRSAIPAGIGALLACLALAGVAGCSVQAGSGITREQGDAIIAELKEIRRTLGDQQKAKVAKGETDESGASVVAVSDSDRQNLGAVTATLTLVEFTDYQCPFCKRFHDRSWPELKAKYVDTGKVRYVVRDLPLEIHSAAMPAAIAARCAGEQGKFWPVHEALFNSQEPLSPEMIRKTVAGFGVAQPAYEKCVADPQTRAGINADIAEAESIGINGTPGFVLGSKKGGKLVGTLILGSQPTDVFTSRIDALLKAAPHSP